VKAPASQSRRSSAGAVTSEQRLAVARPVVAPTPDGARDLGRVYWEEVERFTRGLVRSRVHPAGVELRFLGRAPLLRFGPPEVRAGAEVVVCRYAILGGALARAPGGAISFAQQGGPCPELRSTISGFLPRLAARPGLPSWTGALYEQVQVRLHGAVGRRYFARLVREGA
jgi:hypothetical protein